MNLTVLAEDGSNVGTIDVLDAIFGAEVKVGLMHQVVTAQLAAARSGSSSTKTRAEVSGGGRKPWRQKGTGRARHGSTREPQWAGGGVAHGPKPRSYAQSLPKKMKAAALRSALSARASEEKVLVIDNLEFETPKTKRAIAALGAWKAEGRTLLVATQGQENLAISFRNLQTTHIISEDQLNVRDVLHADTVIFTKSAIEEFQTRAAKSLSRRSGNSEEVSA